MYCNLHFGHKLPRIPNTGNKMLAKYEYRAQCNLIIILNTRRHHLQIVNPFSVDPKIKCLHLKLYAFQNV